MTMVDIKVITQAIAFLVLIIFIRYLIRQDRVQKEERQRQEEERLRQEAATSRAKIPRIRLLRCYTSSIRARLL